MVNKDNNGWDRIKLVLVALVAFGLMFALLSFLDRFGGITYILALITLLGWPFAALWLVRRGGARLSIFAYGIYILLLTYIVGHSLPVRGVSGWLGDFGHIIMGASVLTLLFSQASGDGKHKSITLNIMSYHPDL